MTRKIDYSELLELLEGRTVSIWTCNTCARLCYSIGGNESAERLANKLRSDGVVVVGVFSTSASCIESKVSAKKEEALKQRPDVILALTCDVGADCAFRTFGTPVINPINTVGVGFLSAEGEPMLFVNGKGEKVTSLYDLATPFV